MSEDWRSWQRVTEQAQEQVAELLEQVRTLTQERDAKDGASVTPQEIQRARQEVASARKWLAVGDASMAAWVMRDTAIARRMDFTDVLWAMYKDAHRNDIEPVLAEMDAELSRQEAALGEPAVGERRQDG